MICYNPYLVIWKDDKDGAADEGEGGQVGETDGHDDAGADGQAGQEVADCKQLAKKEKAHTKHPEKQKDLCEEKITATWDECIF